MAMFTQITGLTRLPRTEAERTQVTEGLCWERVPVEMPVFIDVWSDQQFSMQRYTDGIHNEFHEAEVSARWPARVSLGFARTLRSISRLLRTGITI